MHQEVLVVPEVIYSCRRSGPTLKCHRGGGVRSPRKSRGTSSGTALPPGILCFQDNLPGLAFISSLLDSGHQGFPTAFLHILRLDITPLWRREEGGGCSEARLVHPRPDPVDGDQVHPTHCCLLPAPARTDSTPHIQEGLGPASSPPLSSSTSQITLVQDTEAPSGFLLFRLLLFCWSLQQWWRCPLSLTPLSRDEDAMGPVPKIPA